MKEEHDRLRKEVENLNSEIRYSEATATAEFPVWFPGTVFSILSEIKGSLYPSLENLRVP